MTIRVKDASQIGSLFSELQDTGWRPPETLPVLDSRFKRIGFDLETDGVDVWGNSMPIGMAIATEDGRRNYLPWGHRGGGNLDSGLVKRWAKRELAGKTLVTAEGKHEVHMMRKWGVDLEEIGCQIKETQFRAGLLDDTRKSFKLNDMAKDFLGKSKVDIDRKLIWHLPSSVVGPYAEEDGGITLELDDYFEPKIREQGLGRVARLEDDLIYCTCEMERNGAPFDTEKARRWSRELENRITSIITRIHDETSIKVNPVGPGLVDLFKHLSIDYPYTAKGSPSFTDDFLATVDDEYVRDIRTARTYGHFKSKFIDAYLKAARNGIIRYKLHQMKHSDQDGGYFGTISGRYSSSSINCQQVFDPERQAAKMGFNLVKNESEVKKPNDITPENFFLVVEFVIRELFIPRPGRRWAKVDADQIEFRFFAHYSKSKALIDRYLKNPKIDFHVIVQEMIRPFRAISRKYAKNCNFAKLYGSGAKKLAWMLDISEEEAIKLIEVYDTALPEAGRLMKDAMDRVYERGYVKTILGRRARFEKIQVPSRRDPDVLVWVYDRVYSALNRVIQGSSADYLKLKLLEVYRNRKQFDWHMIFTVHDDVNIDYEREEDAQALEDLLNEPIEELHMRVPITFSLSTGANWAEASL